MFCYFLMRELALRASSAQVRQYLDSSKEGDKLRGMKWLLAMMSKGRDVSEFFPDVRGGMVCVCTTSIAGKRQGILTHAIWCAGGQERGGQVGGDEEDGVHVLGALRGTSCAFQMAAFRCDCLFLTLLGPGCSVAGFRPAVPRDRAAVDQLVPERLGCREPAHPRSCAQSDDFDQGP